MQFSLDRKRRSHKQNQCSASDSVGLIFTRSYRFTLLITTPTTTPSLVKTSLKYVVSICQCDGARWVAATHRVVMGTSLLVEKNLICTSQTLQVD